ncbi:hypothetical protein [Microvirga aerophila]|uniref:Uncharacterized protein n=1 Tax=Microvirga aerophila TaxID=670291 RepID=A0A512BPZ8_9HYPH|nr:hypothetical protein [Microvirga aerophila]GEO14025.1 hypothetical protein MAE02_17210 [Microvirga aerophila]
MSKKRHTAEEIVAKGVCTHLWATPARAREVLVSASKLALRPTLN